MCLYSGSRYHKTQNIKVVMVAGFDAYMVSEPKVKKRTVYGM